MNTEQTTNAARGGHTPGPWTYRETDGTILAGSIPIGQVYDNPDDGTEPLDEEPSMYNGLLFAAAPDLLAALIAVRDAYNGQLDCLYDEIHLVEAAIQKATK